MEIQDQLKRKIKLNGIPQRIISLVPSLTELLVDLGLEDHIVGITHFCIHPQDLKKIKTSVGGTKKVNFKKVKDLQPDLILCNKEENTKEMVDRLEEIAPVHVSDVATLGDAYDLIRDYGRIFRSEALAATMINSIQKKEANLRELVKKSRKRRVAYFIWNDPLMVAGMDTFIQEMLQLNNFENVFEKDRYPITSVNELEKLDIDLCLLSSEPFPFKKEHKALFEPLAREIKIVDGEYFSWYGSRLIAAMDYFKQFHD